MQSDAKAIAAGLSDGEKRRLLDGRDDWRDDDWQDHCGDLNCLHCDGYIPGPGYLSAADRAVKAQLERTDDDRPAR